MSETQHFNGLTPGEQERLSILLEEHAEVIQIIGKIQRFGYDSINPETGETNRQMLERELGDSDYAKNLMLMYKDLSQTAIEKATANKAIKIIKYLKHQPELTNDY